MPAWCRTPAGPAMIRCTPRACRPTTCTRMRRSARSQNPCRGRITGSPMLRSSTKRTYGLARYGLALLVALATGASASAQSLTSGPGRFVDIVEVNDHEDQVDIVVQFTCSLRYLTHQPASEGKELRIQMLPQGD